MSANFKYKTLMTILPLVFSLSSCAISDMEIQDGDREDSGWLSDSTYEVGVVLKGRVSHDVNDNVNFENLRTDGSEQVKLIDSQVAFARGQMADAGYQINQLSDDVRIMNVAISGDTISIDYEITTDMVAKLKYVEAPPSRRDDQPILEYGRAPTLEEIEQRHFKLAFPLDPIELSSRVGDRCSSDDSPYDYKYFYYFEPYKEGCDLQLQEASLEITEVFPRKEAYPEYDQLLNQRADGTRGFSAALIPSKGDSTDQSIFNDHLEVFEGLGLSGIRSENQRYVRFAWQRGNVRIDVDVFDPTISWSNTNFREALNSYQMVAYDGHSNYGSLNHLTSKEAFSDKYQIVLFDACNSYQYYSRKVFRAKAMATGTENQRRGWANADVVSTGAQPTFSNSGRGPRELLRGLLDGMAAIDEGQSADAPTWIDIAREINANTGEYALFGAAGVRTNEWKPSDSN